MIRWFVGEKLFPTLNIILCCGASIRYGTVGDTRRCLYWLLVAAINLVISF